MILLALLLWIPASAGMTAAGSPTVHDITPGVVVVGWDRLSAARQDELQAILSVLPRALTPWLRVITVDNAPIPEPLASETCAPNGEVLYRGPCGFNILADPDGIETPFPPDAPLTVTTSVFAAIVIHEAGHQIGHGTAVEQSWIDRLIAEAGNDPIHYLRSMLPPGFFTTAPQEFLSSMWNQWATCSVCALGLALTRWDAGIHQPLDQVVFLAALSGYRAALLDDHAIGTVVAYRVDSDIPRPDLWSAQPWRCGGPTAVSGPGFAVVLTTDDLCHVLTVGDRQGL